MSIDGKPGNDEDVRLRARALELAVQTNGGIPPGDVVKAAQAFYNFLTGIVSLPTTTENK